MAVRIPPGAKSLSDMRTSVDRTIDVPVAVSKPNTASKPSFEELVFVEENADAGTQNAEKKKSSTGQKIVTLGIWILAIAGLFGLVWFLYLEGYLYNFGPLGTWMDSGVDWVGNLFGGS